MIFGEGKTAEFQRMAERRSHLCHVSHRVLSGRMISCTVGTVSVELFTEEIVLVSDQESKK